MIEAYIDGLAEPSNPGIGTYGFVIYRDGRVLRRGHGFAGDPVTNNYAEYEGLVRALTEISRMSDEEVQVNSDSRLLVNQMSGEWKVKRGGYIEKYAEAKELARKFSRLKFLWIPREQNSEADELSRVAYAEEVRRRRR